MIKLANGEFPDIIFHNNKDEISSTIKNMNKLVRRLKKSTELAKDIGAGRFSTDLHIEKTNDVLSRSLVDMKENLLKIQKKNNQTKLDKRRFNTNSGDHKNF